MTVLSVQDAIEKELRKHELPETISGYLTVTPYFSYLVDDLYQDNAGDKQPSILLNSPEIADSLPEDIQQGVGSLVLLQAPCRVNGVLKETGIAAFDRLIYRVSELVLETEEGEEIVLNDIILT